MIYFEQHYYSLKWVFKWHFYQLRLLLEGGFKMNLDFVNLEQFYFISRFRKSLHAPEISGKIYSNLKMSSPCHRPKWEKLVVATRYQISIKKIKHFLISGIILQWTIAFLSTLSKAETIKDWFEYIKKRKQKNYMMTKVFAKHMTKTKVIIFNVHVFNNYLPSP